jgi:general nucleoside transport system permease protein
MTAWRDRQSGAVAVGVTALAAVLVVAALAVTLSASGFDSAAALGAMWRGAFGSTDALLSGTLVRATPLILAGLAVTLAFRAGVWNIGAEGQLLAGAAAATALALTATAMSPLLLVPLALAAGMTAGGAWGAIAAALRVRFGVNEVISTIMLNFIALHLVGWLVRGPLQEPLRIYPQSAMIEASARLPVLMPGTRLHAGVAIAVLGALALWWLLRSTAPGFRIRAVGENPRAAEIAGRVRVARTAALALVASGGIAGVAGAVEVTGVTFALYESLSPGYGFTAIAIALMARLHPLGVVASGVLFGALRSGAIAMQRDAGVPAVIVTMVEGLLILLVLVTMYWRGSVALPARWRAAPASSP